MDRNIITLTRDGPQWVLAQAGKAIEQGPRWKCIHRLQRYWEDNDALAKAAPFWCCPCAIPCQTETCLVCGEGALKTEQLCIEQGLDACQGPHRLRFTETQGFVSKWHPYCDKHWTEHQDPENHG